MQWYSPFRRINSGTRFGHIPAAPRCRRRHLAALPASGPGASASAGWAPSLLGASASAGGAPALRGASAAWGSPRSSRAERKEDGAIRRMVYTFRRMVCTCPFRRMVCTGCYTCLLFVLFGGWSVTHVSYLSFSADGLLNMSPICPFRRMVCEARTCPFGVYTFWRMVCTCCAFGEWSAQDITRIVLTLHPAPYIASGPIAYLTRWVVLVKPRH